jgi:hypothetical protein
MRKIVQCSIIGLAAVTLAGCQTVESPYELMTRPPAAVVEAAEPATRPPAPWLAVDPITAQTTEIDRLEWLTEAFPNSASVQTRLLNAHLEAENTDVVASMAEALTDHGYRFSDRAIGVLSGLFAGDRGEALRQHLSQPGQPLTASTVVDSAPAEIRLPEAALYDPAFDRLFVTSVISRGLFVREGEGAWRELPLSGAGSLSGIALDERYGLIWVGNGVVEQTPDPASASRGLIAIDRSTLSTTRRVMAPEGVSISDIAVGPDGTVYGSDPIGGGVYMAPPGQFVLEPLVVPGTFRSPQGLAVRPDGRSLFVSDYSYGLAVVMLPSRQVYRVQTELPLLLDGVDGLWLVGNELVAVQNGLRPHRIVAFELGAGPGTITGMRVLEQAHPGWTEPLGGAVTGGALTYIGTGQWDIYGEGGELASGASPRPSAIHRLDLGDRESTLPE